MILPQTYPLVLALMILSMVFLGSWASFFKMAGKWRFELFYFDFAFGLIVAVVIYAFTFGNLGYDGFNFIDDLQHAGKRQWLFGFLAGVIFNFANMLLMAAVSVAGMAVAFPMALAVAVLMGTAVGSIAHATGNPLLVTLGCLLLLMSIIVNAVSYRIMNYARHETLAREGKAKSTRRPTSLKGIILAVVSGVLMGSFNPLLDKARAGDVGMGPYAISAMFAFGVFFTTPVFSIFFMNLPVEGDPVDFGSYFSSKLKQHILGIIGGVVWVTGILAGMVAGSVPENIAGNPLVHFMLGNCWPLLATAWGALVFREFRGADVRVKIMSLLMVVLFICGVGMIALGPIYVAGKS
jgi:glucose uptake protein